MNHWQNCDSVTDWSLTYIMEFLLFSEQVKETQWETHMVSFFSHKKILDLVLVNHLVGLSLPWKSVNG